MSGVKGLHGSGLRIREAGESDARVLAEIFRDSVVSVAPARYTGRQVAAWAAVADDESRFRRVPVDACCLIAESDSRTLGFISLGTDGTIDFLYVRGAATRQGIGGLLLTAAIARAGERGMAELRTKASEFSTALFERFGFVVEGSEAVELSGERFSRYLMTRRATTGLESHG